MLLGARDHAQQLERFVEQPPGTAGFGGTEMDEREVLRGGLEEWIEG